MILHIWCLTCKYHSIFYLFINFDSNTLCKEAGTIFYSCGNTSCSKLCLIYTEAHDRFSNYLQEVHHCTPKVEFPSLENMQYSLPKHVQEMLQDILPYELHLVSNTSHRTAVRIYISRISEDKLFIIAFCTHL